MYRIVLLLVIMMLFGCKCISDYEWKYDETWKSLNYMNIAFLYQNAIRENMDFPIVEINNIAKNLYDIFRRGYNMIDKDKYMVLKKEIKKINLINDIKFKITDSYMSIGVYEKDILIENYEFKNLVQIKKYIEISDSIVGKGNFVPIEIRELIKNSF